MNGVVVLLWSAAIALVLIVCGIFVALVMMDRIPLFGGAEKPAAQQTEGAVGELDTSYRVFVINATGEKGLGAGVRDQLVAEGWSPDDVIGSDSSSQEFSQTTVFYVADDDRDAALGVADVLGADAQQSDFYAGLNDGDAAALTVVIGQDRVAEHTGDSGGAPSTPTP